MPDFSDLPYMYWDWLANPVLTEPINIGFYRNWLWSSIQPGKPFEVV